MKSRLYFVRFPLAILGIPANILCLVILKRLKLKRSSDVLLFCIGVANIVLLASFYNVPARIKRELDWKYSQDHTASMAYWSSYYLFRVLRYTSVSCVDFFPVLITVERLVALFLPLHVHLIITKTRIWLACGLIAFLNLIHEIFKYSLTRNLKLIYSRRAKVYYWHPKRYTNYWVERIEDAHGWFHSIVPEATIIVGTLVVIAKLKFVYAASQKISNRSEESVQKATVKATLRLMAFCAFYIFTICVGNTMGTVYNMLDLGWYAPLGKIVSAVRGITLSFYCSAYFLVHIWTNDKFRQELATIFGCGGKTVK